MAKNRMAMDQVIERSKQKLNRYGKELMFAANGKDKVRDDIGLAWTMNRMMTSIQNFADSGLIGSGAVLANEAITSGAMTLFSSTNSNFSASELQSLQDLDVVDISIGATFASHGLTYVAAERPMNSVNQSINFQGLVAENTAAGYTAGQIAYDPRIALNPNIDLSRGGASFKLTKVGTASGELEVTPKEATPVVAGETKVYAILTTEIATGTPTLIGFTTPAMKPALDTGDQQVVWVVGDYFSTGKVNINTGKFTGTQAKDLSTYTIIVEGCIDRIADKTGNSTLKLRPVMQNYVLEAKENRIILEVAIEVQAQMNKIIRENNQWGLDIDYGKRAIDQLVELYTYFIDTHIFQELVAGTSAMAVDSTFDLSSYTADFKSFSVTKNDRILRFMNELSTKLLFKTNKPVTAWLVDDLAAKVLANDTDNFTADPAFRSRRDGFIGYYAGTPVVRNAYLNGKASNATYGIVYGVHKSLDGQVAPVFFGDYLAPYSTVPAVNPYNPGNMSQALFSQNATKCVVPEFVVKGEIISPSI